MRLIDADNFKQLVTVVSIANGESAAFVNEFCELIDSQPTAYDVDKVVYRLICESINCHILTDRAVEIVKFGGIE